MMENWKAGIMGLKDKLPSFDSLIPNIPLFHHSIIPMV
jgi:hypothetical protein